MCISIYLKNIRDKFHHEPIWNNPGALSFHANNNKMSSDVIWDNQFLIYQLIV